MTTGIRTRAIQPLEAPQINAKAATARIVPQDSEILLRWLATAGTSNAIAEPLSAWKRYAADREIFAFNFTSPMPPENLLQVWPSRLASEAEPDQDEQSGVYTIVIGATAPARGHLADRLPEFQPVNLPPITAYRSARRRVEQSREAALADIRRRLDKAKAAYTQRSPREVATELGDELGLGQLVTARAVGVTPTAVRKWRRGEPARPEHRDRLSQLAALCSLLMEVGLHDPAGWIDIPISGESTLTPLDLFAGRRADLVVLLGSGLSDPQETLDAFDPSWRTAFPPDRDYEVVTLTDGSRSVVPRREASG
jgi:hypothetical protein